MNTQQRVAVAQFYDGKASIYDNLVRTKAAYVLPGLLCSTLKKHQIYSGEILDLGCGTGSLRLALPESYRLHGVDISLEMVRLARRLYEAVHLGPIEKVLGLIPDKKYDCVVALSSLYLIEDITEVAKHMARIARRMVFASLEQFDPGTSTEMRQTSGFAIYNHDWRKFEPCTVEWNYLWTRPVSDGTKIFGNVVTKLIEP